MSPPPFRKRAPGDLVFGACLVLLFVFALIGFAQTIVWGSHAFAAWLGS